MFSNKKVDAGNISEIIEVSRSSEEYLTKDNLLYIVNDIDELGIKLGISTPLPLAASSTQLITLSVIIFIIILMIAFFYSLLDKIFKKINNHVRVMEKSIHNNFQIKIPVEKNDEIGQLARGFNALLDKISNLMNDIINKELAHRDTQLKALQYQINPHFIYNTLDIFSSKAELSGLYDVSDAITSFAKMLRYNVNSESIYTSIETEIQYVKSYINLQKLKHDDKIELSIRIPKYIYQHSIIKFILQPLVENSIIHGFTGSKKLDITIHGQLTNKNTIQLIIEDNGSGIDPEKLGPINHYLEKGQYKFMDSSDSHSIGLNNINKRLKLYYGDQYHMRIESVRNSSTKVYVTIPCNENYQPREGERCIQ